MAENKDKLGTNPDEMEDFDFDFDADFGGDFFAEEPPPANKREAVARTLKTAGKSFAEEFDLRDPDKIEKYKVLVKDYKKTNDKIIKHKIKEQISNLKNEFILDFKNNISLSFS